MPAPSAAPRPAGPARAALALAAVLVGGLLLAVLTGQASLARVMTASMAPSVPQGSLVVGRPVRPQELRVGDLLTADVPALGMTVTHRVVGLQREDDRTQVRTRGDANAFDDPWTTTLPADGATRVVAAVPHLGDLLGRGPLGVPRLALPLLVLAATGAGCTRLLRVLREAG